MDVSIERCYIGLDPMARARKLLDGDRRRLVKHANAELSFGGVKNEA